MRIDLNELFTKENNRIEKQIPWQREELELPSGQFKMVETTPVCLELFHSSKRRIEVSGCTSFTLMMSCDRCLEDVPVKFAIEFKKKIDCANLESGDDSDDTQYIVDSTLDIDKIIQDETIINWPTKILCREDCRGICKVCGHNLNVSDCGCDRVVLDPRMAAIQDIFKNANQ